MKTLKLAINNLLTDLGIENKINENLAINFWSDVVGKKIAAVSKAEKIENNILIIKVNSSVWRNELLYHKNDIIERLNKKVGKKIVKDIRFY